MDMHLRILITGLAALVPMGEGEVAVLFPTVSQQDGLPEHRPFLGYVCDQWTSDSRLEKEEVEVDYPFCWVNLKGHEVRFVNARARRDENLPSLNWWQRVVMSKSKPDPDDVDELRAIDWIPRLSSIDESFSTVDPSCLGGNEYDLVTARAMFEHSGFQSCRLEGEYMPDSRTVEIPQCSFRVDGETGDRRTQAVAAAAMYKVDRLPCSPSPTIVVRPMDGSREGVSLTAQCSGDGSYERFDLAMVHLVEERDEEDSQGSEVVRHPCFEGGVSDEHFRAYYRLADRPPLSDEVPLPRPSGREAVKATMEDLACSCDSVFFLDGDAPPAVPGIPPSQKLATPEGYIAGPPLCTPLRMDKPE